MICSIQTNERLIWLDDGAKGRGVQDSWGDGQRLDVRNFIIKAMRRQRATAYREGNSVGKGLLWPQSEEWMKRRQMFLHSSAYKT